MLVAAALLEAYWCGLNTARNLSTLTPIMLHAKTASCLVSDSDMC